MSEVEHKSQTEETISSTEESEEQKKELAAFERYYAAAKKRLAEAGDKINKDTFKNALDKAVNDIKEAGDYSSQTIKRAKEAFKKDFSSNVEKFAPNWEKFKDKSHSIFDVWRDRSAVFLGHAASVAGEWLYEKGDTLEHSTYHAGDMTAGGEFKCTGCGELVVLQNPTHLPPCPKCMATEFRRV